MLEAMSTGLCPVVTDVGGNRAVLGEQLAHRLVPSEDPAALALAWRLVLSERTARERDGISARGRVKQAFALSTMLCAYERLYDR